MLNELVFIKASRDECRDTRLQEQQVAQQSSNKLLKSPFHLLAHAGTHFLAGSRVCIVQKRREYIPIGSGKILLFLTVLKNTDTTAAQVELFNKLLT
ncbi:MAG: hypothetical protein ABUS47_03875 [Steroidobacter sp.]